MYHSAGNYEAFARPLKPAGIDSKTAWIVGSGLAGLATAAFLVRDAQMPGDRITVLEELDLPGGALDGSEERHKGFVIRGGREMEAHFECLWDLFRSVPSLDSDVAGATVLDEFYWLNKKDPNFSLQRATVKQGRDAETGTSFALGEKAQAELARLFLATEESLEGRRINDVLGKEFFQSNFWMYWRTMFAFQEWHSALEMKRYLHRFVNHIGGMPDFSTLKFTRYNQYESLVLPLVTWLKGKGVKFEYGTEVRDVEFSGVGGDGGGNDKSEGEEAPATQEKRATHISWIQRHAKEGEEGGVDLGPDDLVFMTIGSLTENSDAGDNHTPARLNDGPAPAWDLWRRIAAKDPPFFGRPDVFGARELIPETKWESATITTLDAKIPKYIERICKRDPLSGTVVTGGIVTAMDSKWLLSWTVNRQPHFKAQPPDQVVIWFYGLKVDVEGDFVKKTMQECNGEEITKEWLYHLGVPREDIEGLARDSARCVPVMMPYVTSFFMPRSGTDRPLVVPRGARNFAFIGQFAETGAEVEGGGKGRGGDTIFTTEYSVRTAMEATYKLCGVDRGVPEVWASTYDVRCLLDAAGRLRDGKMLLGGKWWIPEWLRKRVFGWLVGGTVVGEMLAQYGLI
ncbi:myosin-crossreactive antigen [Zalerion maritima]|uniref:Myosin-crossreactive antigen n=1 Tax=Zalerion maritima TaxID=339359 RepID=A0AAD5RNQ5_9PEZI|nr:myosin-crossreactive antigen [Zalerion maritima]